MKSTINFGLLLITLILFSNCAGTIRTTNFSNLNLSEYKKAYIVSPSNSNYIKFKFGNFSYNGYYLPPEDDAPVEKELIGNTDKVIKEELEKYGIEATIGKKGDKPEGFDLIVKYEDTWRWDFKKILDKLEIVFISPTGDKVLGKSTYDIYYNKELHNFPTPKKEVPKMIKQLLKK